MTTWDHAARDLLEEARRRAGGGSALATALCEAGVGPESGAYSESAVSNWIKGRTKPHANVLLAACSLYSLSIDRRLAGEGTSEVEASQPTESELSRMREDIDRLAQLVTQGPSSQGRVNTQDVVAVYGTRAEAQAAEPVLRTVAAAQQIDTMGLSLNFFKMISFGDCQQQVAATVRERGAKTSKKSLEMRGCANSPQHRGV
jgi:hypothetical protein